MSSFIRAVLPALTEISKNLIPFITQVNITNKITGKGISRTVSGKAYTEVIQVNHNGCGTRFTSRLAYY
jgi:hypothetical protein